jgi:hypothetical protein
MELKLKQISRAGINEAIAKVELYRYLNEPGEAESICRDIIALEPTHQTALRLLGLAITDQFKGDTTDRYAEASNIFQSLTNNYERAYFCGLLQERKAKAQLRAGLPPPTVKPTFEEAMRYFEAAEKIRPPENDDAILRWNRCVRLLQSLMPAAWEKRMDEVEVDDGPPVNRSPFSAI